MMKPCLRKDQTPSLIDVCDSICNKKMLLVLHLSSATTLVVCEVIGLDQKAEIQEQGSG